MPGNDAPPLYSKEMVIKGRLTLILPYQTHVRLKASKGLFFDLLQNGQNGLDRGCFATLSPPKSNLGSLVGIINCIYHMYSCECIIAILCW